MGSVITMVAVSSGGNQSAISQMDVPMNGRLVGVDWTGFTNFDTTLDFQAWQLSFGSELTVANDSRQVISMASPGAAVVATAVGSNICQVEKYVQLPEIPVGMGERLFIHSYAAASVVGTIFCLLHFDFDMSQAAARRR